MIDLFISKTCPYCQKVMDFMKGHNMECNIVDVSDEDNVLKLLTLGGKDQVPFLYDSENDERIYESDIIIEYLKDRLNYAK